MTTGTGVRSFQRLPAARLLAAVALVLNLLVHLSPLWVPAVERGGIEICTAYGLTVIPAGSEAPAGQRNGDGAAKACPFCSVHAAALLTPPTVGLPQTDAAATVDLSPPTESLATSLAAGFGHQSRAPPVLA